MENRKFVLINDGKTNKSTHRGEGETYSLGSISWGG